MLNKKITTIFLFITLVLISTSAISATEIQEDNLEANNTVVDTNSTNDIETDTQISNDIQTVENKNNIKQADNQYTVTNYNELVSTINTIKTIQDDTEATIYLNPESEDTTYQITETISWGDDSQVVKTLNIIGNGVVVNGTDSTQFLTIANGYTVNLENVTIANCYGASYGGAICNNGTLSLDTVTMKNNVAGTSGGVIDNRGNLSVVDSVFTNNSVKSNGGAIYNYGATANIINTTFYGNYVNSKAGAIYIQHNSNVTIVDSVFTGNKANGTAGYGGAIYNYGSCNTTIINTTFDNNSATRWAGAIYNYQATLTIANSTLVNNSAATHGGALYNTERSNTTITGSTIQDNTATNGPAVYNKGNLTIIDTEIDADEIDGTGVLITQPVTITLSNITGKSNENITITVNIIDDEPVDNAYVILKINGVTLRDAEGNVITVDVVDGVATYTYTLPSVSSSRDYEISAVYSGSSILRSNTTTITVIPATANIEITSSQTMTAGQTVNLTAKITDSKGTAITTGKVVFKLNGKTLRDADGNVIYGYVDENGVASIEYIIPDNYSAKDYVLTAVYTGSGFERSQTNTTITLTKTNTKITASDITINQGDNTQLTATITDEEGNPVTGTTKVAVKINGKTFTQVKVVDGVMDLTLYTNSFTNPTYTITIVAGENSYYNKAEASLTLTVTP